MGSNGGTKRLQLSSQTIQKLNVQKFAEARTAELESLHSIVGNRLNGDFRCRRSKRRRTTSFNSKAAKRRRNLDDEKKENTNTNTSSSSSSSIPRRRIRRRAELKINPEEGFSVTQDGTKRLRTHVWYAKRFTMTKLWGYYLPLGLHGSGRGSRALLKWFRNGALIHDASYYVPIQLEGPEGSLLSILKAVLVPSQPGYSGDVSTSIIYGAIYDNAMLHHIGAPVSKPIAPVTYMWRPCSLRNRDNTAAAADAVNSLGSVKPETTDLGSCFRQLWVWIHASAFDEGYGALKFACQKEMEEKDILIRCFSREGQLAKLQVMGSKAFEVLQKALSVTRISEDSQQVDKKNCVLENEDHISSKAMLSLSVMDPRTITKKRTIPNVPEAVSSDMPCDILGNEIRELASVSETSDRREESFPSSSELDSQSTLDNRNLWDASSSVSPPVAENILCKEKNEQQKKFFYLDHPTSTEVQCSRCCPIMLLKDKNKEGLAIGWSIVLPLSWVRAFWIPLVSKGARAIGLREKHWVASELGLPCFPSDFPDCNAYSSLKASEAAAFDQKEQLHPLSTRPLRVPILPPWDSVQITLNKLLATIGDDNNNSASNSDSGCTSLDSLVPRTSSLLTNFLNEIKGDHLLLFPRIANKKKSFWKLAKDESNHFEQGQTRIASNIIWNSKLCFVRVLLHAFKEGSFEEGAVICAPRSTDISLWTSSSVNIEGGLQIPESAVTSYFKEDSSGKWELQMPEDPTTNHRMPIGFVTTGFVRGSKKKLVAEAFCEALLLAHLRKEQWWNEEDSEVKQQQRRKKEIYVLVRNLRSTAYRLALATIVLEHQVDDVDFL
ncbi:ribonucleases P/MRP protein subunit POP1 isoform X1 [Cannabis sativa]|uniref:ribonucleases P/MRP protein subunit POP1 isoform X1 n=1 Tax=Cannabis sativa TaxID=3483 RepID=UPI0029CA8C75|nr:ribonucleases P/MRP protein subunit POP1 isoform X1 [Cannabis sativa]XP_030481371.2 ribonucleases P/MRP protein subunit POP1 isoform X1 [Cannabis sativa]XP_030481372.2 ribonucleases P/MRP protein subunit POP1 isoform X1 [Cannabis sativa]XP_060957702.1 ribonucleases P/MRP protein subunit POP1 isoform X1 [Cannabis sativa]